jgi:Fur family peroxide stress response transcriptional regulator
MDMQYLSDTLHARGQKVTSQRLHVYQALRGNTSHPTADEVFTTVRATLPTISLATVYKVLHELVEMGQLRVVETGDGPTRFDPQTSQHIHLRCISCGKLLDLPENAAPVQLPATAAGYRVLRYNLTLEGRCPECDGLDESDSTECSHSKQKARVNA